ncbi:MULTISPECIES: hypothetical protein [Modicisalibacter]|uniref:hypothetical protein n=1 Tax=Modicisalibacter TaxID=574347 RepID=UPI00100AE2E9|nr:MULTISPECIES: hypothetical protein [Halomonadaceae]MBZ9556686.1 hypothetical protein [Modicisalibacter sp. R2A 31.J]MBZ9574845.1 hypothetical protein [Modicisalibacter sp. MOD 31.J]
MSAPSCTARRRFLRGLGLAGPALAIVALLGGRSVYAERKPAIGDSDGGEADLRRQVGHLRAFRAALGE